VKKWTGEQDLFTHYRIDEQIAKAMDRKVWLPSGGSLVIDRTEAMTVVDVNTGKFVGSGGNLEETVTKNNIEAAEEIVRQLRLRDIGGIIVIDFIDMVLESNRDLVVRRLLECLGRDRTKHQVAEVTSLGLVQMTRKRVGSGLIEVFSQNCEHCNGRGIIVSADPVDQPAGTNGSSGGGGGNSGGGNSGGGNSGGGNSGGGNVGSGPSGGDNASGGRGSRGRRARGGGSDTSVSVTPEPSKVTSSGPTPAQIAAAAHAAAIHAASHEGAVPPSVGEGPELAKPLGEPPVDQPQEVPVKAFAPAKSRRRSAKSPAVSVASVAPAEPATKQMELVVASAPQDDEASTDTAVPVPVGEVTRPAPRSRRKRARVVAPAGPPRGAGEPVADSGFGPGRASTPRGEFDS
jgi:ribonuclease E